MKTVKVIVFCILFVLLDVLVPSEAVIRPLVRLGLRLATRERNNRRAANRLRRFQHGDHLRMYKMMTRGLVSGYIMGSVRRHSILMNPHTDIHQIYPGLSKLPISVTVSFGKNGGQRKHSHEEGKSFNKKIVKLNLESSPSLVSDCSHNYHSWLKSKDYIEVNTESPMNIIQHNYLPASALSYLSYKPILLFKQTPIHLSDLDYSNQDDIEYGYASSNYAPVIIVNSSAHASAPNSDKQTLKSLASLSSLRLSSKETTKNHHELFEIVKLNEKGNSKSLFKIEDSVDGDSDDHIASDLTEEYTDLKTSKELKNQNYLKDGKRGKWKGQESITSLIRQKKIKQTNDAKNKPYEKVVRLKLPFSLIKSTHLDDSSGQLKIYSDAFVTHPLYSHNLLSQLNTRDVLESIPILVPNESLLSPHSLLIVRYLSHPLLSSNYLLSHLLLYDQSTLEHSSYDHSSSDSHSKFPSIYLHKSYKLP